MLHTSGVFASIAAVEISDYGLRMTSKSYSTIDIAANEGKQLSSAATLVDQRDSHR